MQRCNWRWSFETKCPTDVILEGLEEALTWLVEEIQQQLWADTVETNVWSSPRKSLFMDFFRQVACVFDTCICRKLAASFLHCKEGTCVIALLRYLDFVVNNAPKQIISPEFILSCIVGIHALNPCLASAVYNASCFSRNSSLHLMCKVCINRIICDVTSWHENDSSFFILHPSILIVMLTLFSFRKMPRFESALCPSDVCFHHAKNWT